MAAAAAGPAVMLADEKSADEYPSVHSIAAGEIAAAVRFTLKASVDPGPPDPEEIPSANWPKQGHDVRIQAISKLNSRVAVNSRNTPR